jgi:osmoprotectant transport system permease protein
VIIKRIITGLSFAWCALCSLGAAAEQMVTVGSKNFGESYLLAEIVAQVLEAQGFRVNRKLGLGGTLICYEALKNAEIDLYPEYTGTLSQAVLNLPGNPDRSQINRVLADQGLELLAEYGFNNTYAIVVRDEQAQQLGLQRIGDLQEHNLTAAFSHEFLQREDGWPGLAQRYNLRQPTKGIGHGLAYQAIADGAIDVTDAYSTDGELQRYQLRILQDDLGYFPEYRAATLVQTSASQQLRQALAGLHNMLDESQVQVLNAKVVLQGQSFQQVAADFISANAGELGLSEQGTSKIETLPEQGLWAGQLWGHFVRHLQLTGSALFAAIAVGLGISLLVYSRQRLAEIVVYLCGLLQTIPSLALLALMIPIFGIGFLPAIIALFLYSLLPIVRNAITALINTDPTLVRVSAALGLSGWEQLRYLRLPLATPAIFAGIRTAAVISIGTATLAAFIGAGGLGEPIVVGLSLNDTNMILRGAIPAAILAIVVELVFAALERRVSPPR